MAITEEQIQLARAALDKASRLYGVSVGETIVAVGVLLRIPLPDRIGGHDSARPNLVRQKVKVQA